MKYSIKNIPIQLFFLKLVCTSSIAAYDEIHRYRPILFFGEARLSRDALTSFKIQANHGSASQAYNSCGSKVPAADIFGSTHNQQVASIGTHNMPTTTTVYPQKLTFTELIVTWSQNFARGFFISCYLPFRTIHLYNFPRIEPYNPIQQHESMLRGVGDFASSIGWTYNCEDTEKLDFIDVSAQLGVVLPTSNVALGNTIFDINLGYEGRVGCFFIIDASSGILDWLTVGAHAQGLFFQDHPVPHTLLSSNVSCDLSSYYTHHHTPAWVAGVYSKADHIILGLSGTVGYSFTHQGSQQKHIVPALSVQRQQYAAWGMHTLHIALDYDLATYSNPHAPSIGVAYNQVLAGKNVWNTSLWGGIAEFSLLFTF